MKVLMLIAHGSRKQEANDEIRRLAERVQVLAGDDYDLVTHAFLEIASPGIHDCIEACVARGATEIRALPYFLASGNHVARDIPAELACARAGYPQLGIAMAPYIGSDEAMPGMVLGCSRSILPTEEAPPVAKRGEG